MAAVDSYVMYGSFYEAIRDLEPDTRLLIYDAINEYALYHNEIQMDDAVARSLFTLIRPQIDANFKRRQDGKRGGRPNRNEAKSGEEPEDTAEKNHRFPKTKTTGYANEKPNVNVNGNGNVNVNGNGSISRFVKPTIEEVTSYCRERNNNVDPNKWYDYYVSNGWKVGKNPMKDWKAAIRNWERSTDVKGSSDIPVYDPAANKRLSEEQLEDLLSLRDKERKTTQ